MSLPIIKICAVALALFASIVNAKQALQQIEKKAPTVNSLEYDAPLEYEAPLDDAPPLVTVGQWQISAAIGYGQRSNILVAEDDFDLYLIPSIKYYGESVFFENGTLGFTLHETASQAWSFVTELNPYIAQFYDSHLDNFFAIDNLNGSISSPTFDYNAGFTEDSVEGPNQPTDGPEREYLQQVSLNKPDWSIDFGLQHNWFFDNGTSLITQIFTDISNEHHGQRLEWHYSGSFSFAEQQLIGQWHGMWQLGVSILDQDSTQYYFGIDQRHTDYKEIYYQTSWAVNPMMSVTVFYPFTEKMRFVAFAKYQDMDDTIYKSPKVNDSGISTFYAGVAYDF